MYQIDNHEEEAQRAIVPYLLSFDKIQGITEYSGTRAQYLEDVAWKMLQSTNVEGASGISLDYLGKKVGRTRAYFASPTDGFTFKGTTDQGFGAGKFLSGSDGTLTTKQIRDNATYRNAIKAKIIQNNTECNLPDLINACKLLFNASLVNIKESYPAGLEHINLYGSVLIESTDAYDLCKLMMPGGVSLGAVNFIFLYNLFKRNSFISYSTLVPSVDDFTLSFSIVPDALTTTPISLLCQDLSYSATNPSMSLTYDSVNGVNLSFKTSGNVYSNYSDVKLMDSGLNNIVDADGNTITPSPNTGTDTYYYANENNDVYSDDILTNSLSGGNIYINEENKIKITRVGEIISLYVNDIMVQSVDIPELVLDWSSDVKLFLGVANNSFYNSGSIYNLLLVNETTNNILINDSLKLTTIGNNNGVKFI